MLLLKDALQYFFFKLVNTEISKFTDSFMDSNFLIYLSNSATLHTWTDIDEHTQKYKPLFFLWRHPFVSYVIVFVEAVFHGQLSTVVLSVPSFQDV